MKKTCYLFVLFVFGGLVLAKTSLAANFSLSPASGNYDNGSQFDVVVSVTSGTSKVYAMDVWATFDASKLEILNVVRAYSSDDLPAEKSALRYFEVNKTDGSIDNNTGTLKIAVQNLQSSSHDAIALNNQPMLKITFKAKNTGTANLNFTCSQGSVNDSNIIDAETYEDVISCASNQSGLYTIGGSSPNGGNGDSSSQTTSQTTSVATTTTTSSGQLPQTGVLEYTIGFGILALILLAISTWMFV